MHETSSTPVTEGCLKLEVFTPRGRILTCEAKEIVFPASQGEEGILPDHHPLVSKLGIGRLIVHSPSGTQRLAIKNGFGELHGNQFCILAEEALLSHEIDASATETELNRVETDLGSKELEPSLFLEFLEKRAWFSAQLNTLRET